MVMLVFEYQNVSCLVYFNMHYMCECGSYVFCDYTLRKAVDNQRALNARRVVQAVQPVVQVNPSSRRDTTGCDQQVWLGQWPLP